MLNVDVDSAKFQRASGSMVEREVNQHPHRVSQPKPSVPLDLFQKKDSTKRFYKVPLGHKYLGAYKCIEIDDDDNHMNEST